MHNGCRRLVLASPILLCACGSTTPSGNNYLPEAGTSDVASDATRDTGAMETSIVDSCAACVPDTSVGDAPVADAPSDARRDSGRPDAGDGGAVVHHHVFVTSASYAGQFDPAGIDGLNNADQDCMDTAFMASLPGIWVAWLSDATMDAPSRINDVSPWYLVDDRTLAFPTAASLTASSGPMHPIDQDEHGFPVGIDSTVWTGTFSLGQGSTDTCSNWGSSMASVNGVVGDASSTVQWTETLPTTDTCDKMHHIYCFEQ